MKVQLPPNAATLSATRWPKPICPVDACAGGGAGLGRGYFFFFLIAWLWARAG